MKMTTMKMKWLAMKSSLAHKITKLLEEMMMIILMKKILTTMWLNQESRMKGRMEKTMNIEIRRNLQVRLC
jgi:hypothetical protein